MEKLDEAYQLLDTIKDSLDSSKIQSVALDAFNKSNLCSEAAIILSKLAVEFIEKEKFLLTNLNALLNALDNNDSRIYENLDFVKYELGNLYFYYGMFKKALHYYQKVERKNYKNSAKYKIMTILSFLEDNDVVNYYLNNVSIEKNDDYVKMSFPYLFYEYKQANFEKVKELFEKISERNPYILKIIFGEKLEEENELTKEAYKVFKNNACLINTCPYAIQYLVSLC